MVGRPPMSAIADLEALVAIARRAELTRSGIEQLAAKLPGERSVVTGTIERALGRADARAAAPLMLAAALAGMPMSVEMVARTIPILPRGWMLLPLVLSSAGDRVAMLVELVKARRLPPIASAISLHLAAHLVDGPPPPELLISQVRRQALS